MLARADVFLTREGPRICELNCDTPTGFAEAIVLGELVRDRFPGHRDPNVCFADAYVAMAEQLARMLGPRTSTSTVGIVYPTEMPDVAVVMLSGVTMVVMVVDEACEVTGRGPAAGARGVNVAPPGLAADDIHDLATMQHVHDAMARARAGPDVEGGQRRGIGEDR